MKKLLKLRNGSTRGKHVSAKKNYINIEKEANKQLDYNLFYPVEKQGKYHDIKIYRKTIHLRNWEQQFTCHLGYVKEMLINISISMWKLNETEVYNLQITKKEKVFIKYKS